MDRIDYADRELAVIQLADKLASGLRMHLSTADSVSIAVPGGTTPGPVFDALSAADLDWERVTVMLTDERYLPEESPRSNAGLIRSRLLQGPAAAANFIPFYQTNQDASAAAASLSNRLAPHLPLAIAVFGMGSDMHTASLFPEAAGLELALASDAPAVLPVVAESQPEPRLTLSARVLNSALDKHLLIFGEEKAEALERALGRDPSEAPIMAVLQGGTVHWAP
ncbi:MAG: 6-phosphogluconolactonase [Pseudomonadota bacterium]